MSVVRLILGAILLIGGRQLYWFFVGVAGFIVGVSLANRFLVGGSELVLILVSLAVGFVGALLALFTQRLAVALGGFVAGGYLLTLLTDMLRLQTGGQDWIVYVVGGFIGAIIIAVLFDWALIFLSSLVGATLILQSLNLAPLTAALAFVVLAVIGFFVQALQRGQEDE